MLLDYYSEYWFIHFRPQLTKEKMNDSPGPQGNSCLRSQRNLWLGGLIVGAALVAGITVGIVKAVRHDATPASSLVATAPVGNNIASEPTRTPTHSDTTATSTPSISSTMATQVPAAITFGPSPFEGTAMPTDSATTSTGILIRTTSTPSTSSTLNPTITLPLAAITPNPSTTTASSVTGNPITILSPSPTITTLNPSKTTSNPTLADASVNLPKLGSVDGVAYFYCPATTQENVHHVILLHGGAYTKEIWVENGILDMFCAVPQVSVTALDLSTAAGHESLQGILNSLDASAEVQISKPVVLITPSASGKTIVDWIINGNATDIPVYIETWVPIATGSLPLASDQQMESLVPLPILAINGNLDSAGGKYSQRLARLAGAKAVELQGGHPVYNESPDEFVHEVLLFLGIDT